jgi:Xaa-Pro aminopeptidase
LGEDAETRRGLGSANLIGRDVALKISLSEYRDRQRRLAAALGAAGLDGAIVVSRGGATYDRHANVYYLTGHYQHYSYLPDSPGLFSGRAHTIFVITSQGENVLCVSVPEYEAAELAADEIHHSARFMDTVVDALQELNLSSGHVGLIGADVLPTNQWLALKEAAPKVQWENSDELILRLRRIKSTAERELIRHAASINRRAVTALLRAIVPGITEAEAISEAAKIIISEGAGIYYASISSGDKTWQWTSSPLPGFSTRVLQRGDLLRFDIGIVRHGYLSDFGRAMVVGPANEEQKRLINTLHAGLDATIAAVGPGVSVREVIAAGDNMLTSLGVTSGEPKPGMIVASYPAHWGHALGLGWERPWMTADETLTIEPGMYLAIERALTLAGVGTVAAEQNLLVEEQGTEILTEGPEGRWS